MYVNVGVGISMSISISMRPFEQRDIRRLPGARLWLSGSLAVCLALAGCRLSIRPFWGCLCCEWALAAATEAESHGGAGQPSQAK